MPGREREKVVQEMGNCVGRQVSPAGVLSRNKSTRDSVCYRKSFELTAKFWALVV